VIGPTPGGSQTDILRFTMEIIVAYRWLQWHGCSMATNKGHIETNNYYY